MYVFLGGWVGWAERVGRSGLGWEGGIHWLRRRWEAAYPAASAGLGESHSVAFVQKMTTREGV